LDGPGRITASWPLTAAEKRFGALEQRNDRVQEFNFGVFQSAVFVCVRVEEFEKVRK
jgi:hypothetical protein